MDRQCAALELRQIDELRIVLVGKTGVGKSAAGNTILRRDVFISQVSPSSVTSECEKARGEVDGQWVAVIDTPGVFDTTRTKEEAKIKISQCICFSAPGPHVFLIVIQLGRFTPEEKETVEIIQTTFGEQAAKYTMVLFTYGDQLSGESIEKYVKLSPDLLSFIGKCGGGYHVLNNKDNTSSQVTELLVKINKMVMMNGGSHYTTEMYQQAERAIKEEEERILKENEDKRFKEIEKLKAELKGIALNEEITKLEEKYKREARNKAENKNWFVAVGTAVGAAVGSVGGPVGGAVGAVTGAAVGAAVRDGKIKVPERCSIQ